MTAFINVGVEQPYNHTKKALKGGCTAEPERVRFYSTALFGDQYNGTAADLPEGQKLTVVGPWPDRERKWYATVEKTKDGKVKVT